MNHRTGDGRSTERKEMRTIGSPPRFGGRRRTVAALVATAVGLLLSIAMPGRAEAAPPSSYRCGGWQTAEINDSAVHVLYRACIRPSAVAGKFDGWVQFDANANVTIWFVDNPAYNGTIAPSYGGKWRNLQGAAPDPSSDASYPRHSCNRGQTVQYGVRVREVTTPVVGWGARSWSPAVTCP
jgi:hypothetical protein